MATMLATTNPLREGLRTELAAEPCVVVIFGATGDLTHRKLIPALYHLALERRLPPGSSLVGFARRPWGTDGFRERVLAAAKEAAGPALDKAKEAVSGAIDSAKEAVGGSSTEPAPAPAPDAPPATEPAPANP